MDIMEYLLLEMASILVDSENIKRQSSDDLIDKMNAGIREREEEMLEWCSLEDFLTAKRYYEEDIAKGEKTGLLRVSLQDLLDYTEELIAKKKERER